MTEPGSVTLSLAHRCILALVYWDHKTTNANRRESFVDARTYFVARAMQYTTIATVAVSQAVQVPSALAGAWFACCCGMGLLFRTVSASNWNAANPLKRHRAVTGGVAGAPGKSGAFGLSSVGKRLNLRARRRLSPNRTGDASGNPSPPETPVRPASAALLLSPRSALKTTRVISELMQSPHLARRRLVHMQPPTPAGMPPPQSRSPFSALQPAAPQVVRGVTQRMAHLKESPEAVFKRNMQELRCSLRSVSAETPLARQRGQRGKGSQNTPPPMQPM